MASSSSWSNKLETRLSSLTDGASKESLQSLAKWVGFNRKHIDAFCVSLSNLIQKDAAARTWLYLNIIHEVLLLEKGNETKWNRLSETRNKLGETVLVPTLEESDAAQKARVAPLVDEWENANVFGSPTLIEQMRKILSSETEQEVKEDVDSPKPAETAAAAMPKEELPQQTEPVFKQESVKQDQPKETKDEEKQETKKEGVKPKTESEKPPLAPAKRPPLRRASSFEEIPFDFDGSGIPYSKVESREFLEPCKAIATLQIARDLRNDAAVQLSSRLSSLPEEVKEFCREAQEKQEKDGSTIELSEEQAEKYAKLIGDDLLDTDLDEALVNVKTFMSIVEQQKKARQELIQLLIQSRCQFGSDEAAKVFYSLDGIIDDLKKRKQLLSDALDLEGFEEGTDFKAHDTKEAEKKAAKLEPLSWYNASEEPDAKRAKLE